MYQLQHCFVDCSHSYTLHLLSVSVTEFCHLPFNPHVCYWPVTPNWNYGSYLRYRVWHTMSPSIVIFIYLYLYDIHWLRVSSSCLNTLIPHCFYYNSIYLTLSILLLAIIKIYLWLFNFFSFFCHTFSPMFTFFLFGSSFLSFFPFIQLFLAFFFLSFLSLFINVFFYFFLFFVYYTDII